MDDSRRSIYQQPRATGKPSKFKVKRRQTFHSQYRHGGMFSTPPMHFEVAELIRKPVSNLSVPRILSQRGSSATSLSAFGSTRHLAAARQSTENRSFLTVAPPSRPSSAEVIQQRRPSSYSTSSDTGAGYRNKNLLCPIADLGSAKARIPSPELLSSDTSTGYSGSSRSASISSYGGAQLRRESSKEEKPSLVEDLDVQSVINERRPSKLKSSAYPGYGLYVKEEGAEASPPPPSSLPLVCLEADDEAMAAQDERCYVSVGVGRSSVELSVFVDDSECGGTREQETQADAVVVVVDDACGKRRKKSPPLGDPKA